MSIGIAVAVVGLMCTAAVGAALVATPWDQSEATSKREAIALDDNEVTDPDPKPTQDKTRDTNTVEPMPANDPRAAGRQQEATRSNQSRVDSVDRSVEASPTSGVTRDTISGGAGTVDAAQTSGVTRGTASGGAGTSDGRAYGGGGGDSRSRSRSRG